MIWLIPQANLNGQDCEVPLRMKIPQQKGGCPKTMSCASQHCKVKGLLHNLLERLCDLAPGNQPSISRHRLYWLYPKNFVTSKHFQEQMGNATIKKDCMHSIIPLSSSHISSSQPWFISSRLRRVP